jgi:hypothetical protein
LRRPRDVSLRRKAAAPGEDTGTDVTQYARLLVAVVKGLRVSEWMCVIQ